MISQYKPSRFRQAMDTALWEGSALHMNLQSIAGMNHAQICAGLLEHWGFKETLVTAIRLQYAPEAASSHLVASLYAANLISKALLPNESAVSTNDLPDCVQRALGGTFSTVFSALGDLQAIVDAAKSDAAI
jgi:HD-like signal output (HDOD) protein